MSSRKPSLDNELLTELNENLNNFSMTGKSEKNSETVNDIWERNNLVEQDLTDNKKIIFIRHLEKAYKNNQTNVYGCDPPLNDIPETYMKIITNYIESLAVNNFPARIICSPFLRCRLTAELIRNIIFKKYQKHIVIYVERDFGEYLGNQFNTQSTNIKSFLYPETNMYDPIIDNKFSEFRERSKTAFISLKNTMQERNLTNVWVITHKIVIGEIIKAFSLELVAKKIEINELDAVRYSNKNFEICSKSNYWRSIPKFYSKKDKYSNNGPDPNKKIVVLQKHNSEIIF